MIVFLFFLIMGIHADDGNNIIRHLIYIGQYFSMFIVIYYRIIIYAETKRLEKKEGIKENEII